MFDLKCSLTKEDLKGKVIFWDVDGVLAPFRFNGRLASLGGPSVWEVMTDNELKSGIFQERLPSKFVQRISRECGAAKQIVLGHYLSDKEVLDKNVWLKKHYSYFDDVILIPYGESKGEALIAYCVKNGLRVEDAVFIDDSLGNLTDAEHRGISSWHVSSLMDYFE